MSVPVRGGWMALTGAENDPIRRSGAYTGTQPIIIPASCIAVQEDRGEIGSIDLQVAGQLCRQLSICLHGSVICSQSVRESYANCSFAKLEEMDWEKKEIAESSVCPSDFRLHCTREFKETRQSVSHWQKDKTTGQLLFEMHCHSITSPRRPMHRMHWREDSKIAPRNRKVRRD